MKNLFAIIDVETTGGRANRDRITEIAIALHDGEKVVKTFESLINPECPIPYGITELTGITNDMVADAPRFYEVAKEIVQLTEGAVFVAHNVRFDYGFIREEFNRLGFTYSRRQLCTVRLSRQVFPGLQSYSLGNLIRHFKIRVNDRHRAMADVLATTEIFEKILVAQNGKEEAKTLINQGIKETKLPQGITLDFLQNLPEACGVYYFHDAEGDILYVGKAINIRKRVMEHFADQTKKSAVLHQHTRDISFEVTGSELVALLLESSEIKRIQPPVNRAQRQTNYQFVIHHYLSADGYLRFEMLKPTAVQRKKLQVINEYPKITQAKGAVYRVMKEFELCPKMLHLEDGAGACFHYHIKECYGACAGLEPPESYNERAEQALGWLANVFEHPNFFILDQGRTQGEKSVVQVENGELIGYGYVDTEFLSGTLDELADSIQPLESNPEVRKIIRRFMAEARGLKVIKY